MNEVSGRVLGLFVHAEKRFGMKPGQLARGLGVSLQPAPDRVDWNTVCALFQRLEEIVGPDEALAKLGMEIFEMPEFTGLVQVLGLVASPKLLYWASTNWGGPRMFPNLKDTLTERPDGTLFLTTDIPERFAPCPQLLWFNLGFYRAVPRLLGLGLAPVVADIGPRRATYLVTPPPSLTLWSRARHLTRAITSAGAAVQELATLNQSLQRQFQDAEKARHEAERQKAEAEVARDAALRSRADADRARLVAEDALRVKSEFLATISHELRTPLNGVLGMTSILMDTPLDADQLECVETVRLSGETLLSLISDVLDFARIDAGKLAINAAPFDLSALVEEILQVTASRAHDKGLELTSSFPEATPRFVIGDAERIRQVLLNLVGNAIKFTDTGDVRVVVTASAASAEDRAKLTIAVEDTGIGIPAAARERIFEAFTQADGSMTRRYGGSGLGLTISRRLVELMGGAMRLESDVGKGSRFAIELELPIERSPASAETFSGKVLAIVGSAAQAKMIAERLPGARVEHEPSAGSALDRLTSASEAGAPFALALIDFVSDEETAAAVVRAIHERASLTRPTVVLLAPVARHKEAAKITGVDRVITTPVRRAELTAAASAAADAQARSAPKKSLRPPPTRGRGRILVVDDNRINQLVIARLCSALGYDAEVAVDGAAALDAMETSGFDAVLMDWQMPGLDGLAATRRIKSMGGRAAATPIIALTANAFPRDRELCLAAGMSDYLAKPVDMQALGEALARWIPRLEAQAG